jgi:dTDP-4-amino-4,6-dideoxy-D-glucose transaminase
MLSNFGPQAQQFERLARSYTAVEHGYGVGTCDIGLTLAVRALGLDRGAEVLVPSFTFNSTLHSLLWNDLRPRFIDVDPGTFGISAATVTEGLTDDTALVVGTHVFGVPCDVGGIEEICAERDIPCLFDAAQAFGTWVGDRHVGRYGDASVFSFSGTKVCTSGEGGFAVFRAERVGKRFGLLRGYGFEYDYISRAIGLNGKLSEIHAALGALTVSATDQLVERRKEIVISYRGRFDGVSGISLQRIPADVRPSYTYMPVDLGDLRDTTAQQLADADIETKPYFRPLHQMRLFENIPHGGLPVTERLGSSLLCLPLYPDLEDEQVDEVAARVCAAVNS